MQKCMRLFYFILFSLCAGGYQSCAIAQTAQASMTSQTRDNLYIPPALGKYLAHIQTHHQAMKYIKSRIDIAQEGVTEASLGNRPQITAQGSYGKAKTVLPNDRLHSLSKSGSVNLSQPLYTGGRLDAAQKLARATLSEEKHLTDYEVNQFLFESANAYAEFFKQKAFENLYQQEVKDAHKQVLATTAELKAGERTATDLAIANARLATAQANLARTTADLNAAKEKFVFYVGSDIPKEIENISVKQALTIPQGFTPPSLAELYQYNPRIQEINASVNTAAAQTQRARAEYAPSLSMDAQASYNDRFNEAGQVLDSKDYSLLARYNIPLYSRGMEYSAVRKATLQEGRAKNQLISVSGDIMAEYKANILKYQASEQILNSYGVALKASKLAAKAAAQEYQYGFRTITELADARNDVLKAKADYITAQTQRLMSLIAILKDINRLGMV